MKPLLLALFLLFIPVLTILLNVLPVVRAASLLKRWAQRNGYRILHREHRWLFQGPFSWNLSNLPVVYRIRVQDRQGNHRGGWVRCGHWLWGVLSDSVEVRWDNGGRAGTG